MKKLIGIFLLNGILAGGGPAVAQASQPTVNQMQPDGKIQNWVVLAPFPNQKTEASLPPENVTRQGFQIDFLKSLGGENQAKFDAGTTVKWEIPGDTSGTAKAVLVHPNDDGIIDFLKMFPNQPNSVVYAGCTLHSEVAQPVHFFLGHDDCAKMWLNGEMVYRTWRAEGHGRVPREYYFAGKLQAGANRIW